MGFETQNPHSTWKNFEAKKICTSSDNNFLYNFYTTYI